VSGPVSIVSLGLVVLVLICLLLLALLDPDSILTGSRWLSRAPHRRGGEHPLEP
jgi:hypothetical protein